MSGRNSPIIVNLAPTGMVPQRQDSPHVPLSEAEIIRNVIECLDAGANVVHLHARDTDGLPTWRREVYGRLIAGIRDQRPDAVLGVSLSGRDFSALEQRADVLALPTDLLPDLASLTLSSLNFATGPSVNAPDLIRRLAATMAEKGIRPELEVFDLGMVNYARYLVERDVLQAPLYFNVILGNVAGAQPTATDVAAILAAIPATPRTITVGGIGRAQLPANLLGLVHADGVRTGLEDSLWWDDDRTVLATNQQLVERIVGLAATLGRRPAGADEVRARLGLRSR